MATVRRPVRGCAGCRNGWNTSNSSTSGVQDNSWLVAIKRYWDRLHGKFNDLYEISSRAPVSHTINEHGFIHACPVALTGRFTIYHTLIMTQTLLELIKNADVGIRVQSSALWTIAPWRSEFDSTLINDTSHVGGVWGSSIRSSQRIMLALVEQQTQWWDLEHSFNWSGKMINNRPLVSVSPVPSKFWLQSPLIIWHWGLSLVS